MVRRRPSTPPGRGLAGAAMRRSASARRSSAGRPGAPRARCRSPRSRPRRRSRCAARSAGAKPTNQECGACPGPSCAVPLLPAVLHTRTPSRRPRTGRRSGPPRPGPWRPAAIAACSGVITRPMARGSDAHLVAVLGHQPVDEGRLHQHAVIGDGGRDERHLERRREHLGLPVRRVGQLHPVGEPVERPVATVDLAGRRRQLEVDGRPEAEARPRPTTSAGAPVSSPACANQMLLDTSIASSRSRGWSSWTVRGASRMRKPSRRKPRRDSAGWSANVVSAIDGARLEARGGRHQLEHRPGHVAPLGGAVEQRRVGVLRQGSRGSSAPWPGRPVAPGS